MRSVSLHSTTECWCPEAFLSLSHGTLHSHSSGMRTMDVIRFHCTRSRLCLWQQIGTSLSGSHCRTVTLLSLLAYVHIYSVQPLRFHWVVDVGIPLLMYHLVTFWKNWKAAKESSPVSSLWCLMVNLKKKHFSTHREPICNKSANNYRSLYISSNYMLLYRQCPFETKFGCLVSDSWGSWRPEKKLQLCKCVWTSEEPVLWNI